MRLGLLWYVLGFVVYGFLFVGQLVTFLFIACLVTAQYKPFALELYCILCYILVCCLLVYRDFFSESYCIYPYLESL